MFRVFTTHPGLTLRIGNHGVATNDTPTLDTIAATAQYDYGNDIAVAINPSATLADRDGKIATMTIQVTNGVTGDTRLASGALWLAGPPAVATVTDSAACELPAALQQQAHFLVTQPRVRLADDILPDRPVTLDIARPQQQRVLDGGHQPDKTIVAL